MYNTARGKMKVYVFVLIRTEIYILSFFCIFFFFFCFEKKWCEVNHLLIFTPKKAKKTEKEEGNRVTLP